MGDGERYDVVADTIGDTHLSACARLLGERGRLLAIAGGVPDIVDAIRTRRSRGRRVIAGPADERPGDVRDIAELARSGALRPVIDRVFEFSDMREAHAYVGTRHKRGSVVVRVPAD